MEDLFSIAFAAVDTAIKKYDSKKNRSFYSYWHIVAMNGMKTFVRSSLLSSNGNPISFDAENEFGGTLHEVIPSEDIDREISIYNSLTNIINDERCKLSKNEKMVITLSLNGFDYKEIAKTLRINKTSVYRLYNSAINKIRHSIIGKK